MSVSVKNITKLYGAQRALDDVSFEIKTGEVVGFLGPNGAGKSTMMKIITCFLPPSSGEVQVCGHDVITDSIEVRRKVGYLPEHNPLYLEMYVKEYLEFIAGVYRVPNAWNRVNEMIGIVGLELEQRKKIGALSKGYRQRVGLAQALIHDPEVLILDEPTSGLDPNQLAEIRKLIKSIGEEKTVMLSTHIMQEVEAMCDRIIIINRGRIVANDEATSVVRETEVDNIVNVEFDGVVERKALLKIPGVRDAENLSGNNWRLKAVGKKDVRKEIARFAQQNGLLVLTLQKEEQSLEDAFKKLTGKEKDTL